MREHAAVNLRLVDAGDPLGRPMPVRVRLLLKDALRRHHLKASWATPAEQKMAGMLPEMLPVAGETCGFANKTEKSSGPCRTRQHETPYVEKLR